jgi:hypothetical protein
LRRRALDRLNRLRLARPGVRLYEVRAASLREWESLCSAYHPPEYVHRRLAEGFELLSFLPAADEPQHDLHLFREP